MSNRGNALPNYADLIYPTLRAVEALAGSARSREITDRVLEDVGATEEQLALTYENRPKSILIDRLEWARSYAKLGGALESPSRGLYVITPLGKEILGLPEAEAVAATRELDRQVRTARARSRRGSEEDLAPPLEETEDEDTVDGPCTGRAGTVDVCE